MTERPDTVDLLREMVVVPVNVEGTLVVCDLPKAAPPPPLDDSAGEARASVAARSSLPSPVLVLLGRACVSTPCAKPSGGATPAVAASFLTPLKPVYRSCELVAAITLALPR